jgi:VanZ family protein
MRKQGCGGAGESVFREFKKRGYRPDQKNEWGIYTSSCESHEEELLLYRRRCPAMCGRTSKTGTACCEGCHGPQKITLDQLLWIYLEATRIILVVSFTVSAVDHKRISWPAKHFPGEKAECRLKRMYTMKNKKIIWIWLPTLIVILAIFFLSSENGGSSHEFSTKLALQVLYRLSKLTHGKIGLFTVPLWKLDQLIRKLAHITEYTVLAFTVSLSLSFYRIKIRKLSCLCFIICFIYACCDEFHQLFILERSGRLTDVFIDCIGMMIGIAMFRLVSLIAQTIRKNTVKTKEKVRSI